MGTLIYITMYVIIPVIIMIILWMIFVEITYKDKDKRIIEDDIYDGEIDDIPYDEMDAAIFQDIYDEFG